ncbi:murein L,D-transpeptidase catalytic domain-containing protein, partial [Streptomyces caeruleatus]
ETHKAEAGASNRLVIVDYGQHSKEKRLHIVDLETGAVTSYRAAHGRGSDKDHDGMLDAFSDKPGSSASPGGAYVIAEEYWGKHGRSLRLDG